MLQDYSPHAKALGNNIIIVIIVGAGNVFAGYQEPPSRVRQAWEDILENEGAYFYIHIHACMESVKWLIHSNCGSN